MKAKLSLLLLIFSLFSCAKKMENTEVVEKDEMLLRVGLLKESMISYMEDANPSYTEKDVEQCNVILKTYLKEIAQTESKEAGIEVVKGTIIQLNELNKKCDFELIETSERELIAEIIILASSKKGYNSQEEDITEKWREW